MISPTARKREFPVRHTRDNLAFSHCCIAGAWTAISRIPAMTRLEYLWPILDNYLPSYGAAPQAWRRTVLSTQVFWIA
jgi:hypothetical protein